MCGICGVFSADGHLSPEVRSAVPAMTAAITHRGPDGDGFFSDEYAVFGHRRLAVIDPVGGKQPMTNEDGSCWIVFNGEIYNHKDLRKFLEDRGHHFRSSSDTEVILHAYEEFGPACVERFDGMFAFAIYHRGRRELFAARDRLGKKPFFYAVLDGIFHFGSELASLRCSPLWKGDVDLSGLEGYLSLGYVVAPSTMYVGVQKLPPACTLRVVDGGVRVAEYWDIREFDTDDRPESELVRELDERLRSAVHRRLESAVPLGAFLSGGVDSGLVVSYMAEVLADRLVTVSVGFGETAHNELEAASWTASHFGSRHYFEVIQPRLAGLIGPVTTGLGEPMADSSAIPTWEVSRAARSHVTVALTGDGADEAFGGYGFRYGPHSIEAMIRPVVPKRLASVVGSLTSRWPRSVRLPRALRFGPVLENLTREPAAAYYTDLTFLRPADTRSIMGQLPDPDPTSSPVFEAVTRSYRKCGSKDAVQRAEYADLKVYLPNNSLVKVDRMSMAHGLEVRCPFLDHSLVEFAFRVPATRKFSLTHSKRLLRRLARRRLPKTLWKMPKRGFTAPIGEWIAKSSSRMFEEEVLGTRSTIGSYVDLCEVRRRFRIHTLGKRDYGYLLWCVWVLERWFRAERSGPRFDRGSHLPTATSQ